jgi:hypothetical protein
MTTDNEELTVDNIEFGSLVVCEGDFNLRAIGITFETAIAILREGDSIGGDALALYCFYCITARRQQRGQEIHATTGYCSRGLGWSVIRIRRAKKRLQDLDLAKEVTVRDRTNRIVQHRIRINFLLAGQATVGVFQRVGFPSGGNQPTIEDKGIEGKKNKGKYPLPPELVELESDWQDWLKYKRERHSPMTPSTYSRQIAKLKRMGVTRAKAALQHTIENGWAGIYEPHADATEQPLADRLSKLPMRVLEKARADAIAEWNEIFRGYGKNPQGAIGKRKAELRAGRDAIDAELERRRQAKLI